MKRSSRRWMRWLRLAIILATFFLCGYALLGFKINLPGQLQTAQAKWESQNIVSYRYRAQFGAYAYVGGVFITVTENMVMKVEQDGNTFNLPDMPTSTTMIDVKPEWYIRNFAHPFPEDLSDYTFDELFVFLSEKERESQQPIIELCNIGIEHFEAEYNPTFGFIEELLITNCPSEVGGGLMCPVISHCSYGFRVTYFEVLAYAED